jgi:hypothetical protein
MSRTSTQIGGGANFRFNVGLILDLTEHHHLLFSAGRGIVGESVCSAAYPALSVKAPHLGCAALSEVECFHPTSIQPASSLVR